MADLTTLYAHVPALLAAGERGLSTDEMTGMQALERQHPTIPMGLDRAERQEFEYIRRGTLTLIANSDVAQGTVVAPSMGPTRTEADFVIYMARTLASDGKGRSNALLTVLFLSETCGGRVHDKRMADATPYPLPAGSRLLQDLGFLAFTFPYVDILMPTKKPRDQDLTLEQKASNQALTHRRLRIEHVNRSVKRCRIVEDRIRLWKEGVRDVVMEICCALHNFRVRLTSWRPMV
jgi:hypothetical protein